MMIRTIITATATQIALAKLGFSLVKSYFHRPNLATY